MDRAPDTDTSAPGCERALRLERERKALHLRLLLEEARELSGMLQPRRIVETFLLTAMGAVGAVRGMALLARPHDCTGEMVSRGLPPAEAETLSARLPEFCDAFFPYRDLSAGQHQATISTMLRAEGAAADLLPAGMGLVYCFQVDQGHCGLLALGPLLAPPADASEVPGDLSDLMHSLLHVFIGSLRGALAVSSIQRLGADLGRKNQLLTETLEAAQAAQRAQELRLHQLSAINELAGELSYQQQVRGVLDSFLLTMLGAFSVARGLLFVLDRPARHVELVVRGAAAGGLGAFPVADALLYKAFLSTGTRSVAPLTVQPITAEADALREAGLPFAPGFALYLALDGDVQGMLVLGETLTGEPLDDADRQLLRAQVTTLLGFVQGARRLSTISALNEDLARRNEELTCTVKQLTEARQTIALLERAGERVRAFLQAEGQRSRRFSWLDCGIILAAAMLLGFLFNLASPNGVPLVPEHLSRPPAQAVSAAQARELAQTQGAIVVDARPQVFYDQRRIAGALNLTPALFDMVYLMRLAQTPTSTPIIVYGGNISRRWDEDVAARLTAREHERVLVLQGGLADWADQGFPVEP